MRRCEAEGGRVIRPFFRNFTTQIIYNCSQNFSIPNTPTNHSTAFGRTPPLTAVLSSTPPHTAANYHAPPNSAANHRTPPRLAALRRTPPHSAD